MFMRRVEVLVALAVAAAVAAAGIADAQVVKGAGKSSITIVKTPAPGPSTPTPKTAGSVSSKALATVVGKPPTGGGSFAIKLSKDVGDPAKPGFADGNYVLEVEASATPTGNMVADPLAAAFFITFTVTAGKCTLDNHPDFTTGSPNCGGTSQPVCAADPGIGKCSATLYQVAGNLFQVAGGDANQPFGARFRIRPNVDTANCKTGHLIVDAAGESPSTSTCRDGAVIGVGGVALGTPD
jgi:hypothetical protein